MLPTLSMAADPMNRYAASGAYGPCWNRLGGPPAVWRISYHRTPAEPPAVTAWLTTSDSWSPKLRYARRNMIRSESESRGCDVPPCGMHVPDAPQATV